MHHKRSRTYVAIWLCVGMFATCLRAVEDGVYESDAQGVLGKQVTLTVTRGQIYSLSNANDRWTASVCFPQVGFQEGNNYSVVLAGKAQKITSYGKSGDKEFSLSVDIAPSELDLAKTLFGLPIHARQHLSYAIDGTFTTAKEVYEADEKIVVTLVIRNVGDQPFYFQQGGHQRGPRDDQFQFSGVGPDGPLTMKSAMNFGGRSHVATILPHAEFSLSVDLDGWIDVTKPGSYALMGSYLLPIHKDDDMGQMQIWEDYLTRPCTFQVQGPDKK